MSYQGKYISAVIVAAGMGKRMKSSISKQFLPIGGRPILSHTIKKFNDCKYIDEIIIVTREEERDYCKKEIVEKYNFSKVTCIVYGGKERQDSVYNGLLAVNKKCDIVLIHDGVRPFVDPKSIISGIKGAVNYGACVVGVPVKDTIKVVSDDNDIIDTPKRSTLWAAQTPQCFQYDIIFTAYQNAIKEGFIATDDSKLVENLGYKVKMIMGSHNNIKITIPEDLEIADALLSEEENNKYLSDHRVIQTKNMLRRIQVIK